MCVVLTFPSLLAPALTHRSSATELCLPHTYTHRDKDTQRVRRGKGRRQTVRLAHAIKL